jgi:hypothetical protein
MVWRLTPTGRSAGPSPRNAPDPDNRQCSGASKTVAQKTICRRVATAQIGDSAGVLSELSVALNIEVGQVQLPTEANAANLLDAGRGHARYEVRAMDRCVVSELARCMRHVRAPSGRGLQHPMCRWQASVRNFRARLPTGRRETTLVSKAEVPAHRVNASFGSANRPGPQQLCNIKRYSFWI